MAKTQEEQLFEQVEEVNDSVLADVPDQYKKPIMGSAEWSDWVLSHLKDDEKDRNNGLPKTDGLGRLIPLLIGDIVESSSEVTHVVSVGEREYMAFAKHTLRVRWRGENEDRVFTGVGDASVFNADKPYCKYLSPIASSRARGRAYRDCLMVKSCTAEEVSKVAERDNDDEDGEPITSAQKAAITNLCRRLGINLDLFLNSGSSQYKSIDQVPQGTARQMIGRLNGYQSNPDKKIPEEIKG